MSNLVWKGIATVSTRYIWIVRKPNKVGDDAKYWE